MTILLIAAVVAALAALAFLALRGSSAPSTLQDRTRAVGQTLRCPVCQDLSVADSPSAIAREMRSDISRRLTAGESPDAIRAYYVGRYGSWILLSPPKSGVTLAAWLLPGLLVAVGLVLVVSALTRWTGGRTAGSSGTPAVALTAPDRRLLDRAQDELGEGEERQ